MAEEQTTQMKYVPFASVWEVTMNCNMRCKHCGSSCEGPMPDELTTEEALKLCDDLGELGLNRMTLSGGEVFTRPDWPLLIERLTKNKIRTNVLSNGWLLDKETVQKAKAAGISNVGISLDGLEETHDFIRKKGSYKRIMDGLDVLKKEGVPASIVSCLHKRNMPELPELKKVLVDKGVVSWQLQAAVPMGNLLNYPEWLFDAHEVDDIIDFAYDVMKEGQIRVYLADDVGYFNCKEIEVRKNSTPYDRYTGIWEGCPAGKRVIGVRTNGDIIGCLSIRDDSLIEGNIRETPLKEIWTRPGAFAWNREMDKSKLEGFCKTCQYGSYCLGGCSGTKLIRYKTIAQNEFCSYRIAVEKEQVEVDKVDDFDTLLKEAKQNMAEESYQLAALQLTRALELKPGDTEVLNLLGFVHFSMENYPECEEYNRTVLKKEPENAYSLKGLGLCLSRMGQVEKGIESLKRSIELADDNFLDPYHDLAVVFTENDRCPEAIAVLEQARNKSEQFKEKTENFYQALKKAV